MVWDWTAEPSFPLPPSLLQDLTPLGAGEVTARGKSFLVSGARGSVGVQIKLFCLSRSDSLAFVSLVASCLPEKSRCAPLLP